MLYNPHAHADPIYNAPALEARHIVARHTGSPAHALNGVSLRVPSGTRIALVGPNGAGKSTLLKVAAGLLKPQSGEVLLFGNVYGLCHCHVAYLPQRGELDWKFPINVRRLVMTGRYVHLGWFKSPTREDERIVDDVLERLKIKDLAERQISDLSGGQQQRALLARALAQEADLMLLDEPLNAVDADTRAVIAEVLATLKQQGKTTVIATHDLGRLETDFDGALYLSDGCEVPPPPGSFVGIDVN